MRASSHLVPFTCNFASCTVYVQPLRLSPAPPLASSDLAIRVLCWGHMFQTCCAVWHICFKSYCFALRGSILRVQIGRKIAPRRGPGRSRELPRGAREGARGFLERSLSQLEPDVPLGTLLGPFLEPSWSLGTLLWPFLERSWSHSGPLLSHLGIP